PEQAGESIGQVCGLQRPRFPGRPAPQPWPIRLPPRWGQGPIGSRGTAQSPRAGAVRHSARAGHSTPDCCRARRLAEPASGRTQAPRLSNSGEIAERESSYFLRMTRVIRLPDPLSANLSHLRASETVAVSAEAKRRKAAGEDVLDLGAGEPDFDTPAPAAQAGVLAIQRGYTHYPPNTGIAELRHAIAKNLSRLSANRPVAAENIVVSSGSKQSLFN